MRFLPYLSKVRPLGLLPLLALCAQIQPLQAQYSFVPTNPQWDPAEILSWSPATDPDAPFNRGSVPLAPRFTAPTAAANPALSSLWNVNPHARPGEGRIQAVTTFNTIPAGATHGWPTTYLYAPTIWQYTDSLVFWGGSDRDTKVIKPPTAHTIDAAHRNGVPIYGKIFFNFNTEPDNAALQKVRDLLVKSGNTFPVADKLVESAKYYGFDGWFINQENYQTTAADAQDMRDFLVYFRQKAATEGAPDLRITWYDAMADDGTRSFQNALNANNDGYLKTPAGDLAAHDMFMNFWWYYDANALSSSRAHAQSLGLDPYNLHAGIWTEWNRVYGSTPDPNAGGNITVPWESVFPEGQPHHTSLALFGSEAPFMKARSVTGTPTQDQYYWSGPNADPANTAPTAGMPNWNGMAHYIPANSAITTLPFITNFNAGQGNLYRIDGTTRMTGPWTNLSVQDILPTWRWNIATDDVKLTPSLDFTESYYGGSSLKVTGNLNAGSPQELRLYQTRLPITAATGIRLVYKAAASSDSLIEVGYAFEDEPGVMHHTTGAETTSTTWTTADFPLGAHAGRSLALITLRFSSPGSVSGYTVNIGRIQVSEGAAIIPTAPSNLLVEGTAANPNEAMATQVKLKWTASPGPVLHYNVYYRPDLTPATDNQRVWLGATPLPNFFAMDVRRIAAENTGYIQVEAVSPSYGVSAPASLTQPFTFQPAPDLGYPVIGSYPFTSPLVIGSSTHSSVKLAFDNIHTDAANFAEPGGASGAWVGLDLGAGNEKRITAIRYAPRHRWVQRSINGVFQGSNTADFSSGVVQLAKIDGPGSDGFETTLAVTSTTAFRYLRYLSPGDGYANIAEVKFYGAPGAPTAPSAFQGVATTTIANLGWSASIGPVTGYTVKRATNIGGPYVTVATDLTATTFQDTGLTAGTTYHYVVTARNNAGESTTSARLTLNPAAGQKLTGTVVSGGTPLSPNTPDKVFDGNLTTRFEVANDTGWVGLDLGAVNTKVISAIRYSPRNSSVGNLTNANFMIGGLFQASNSADFSNPVTLFTIPGPPAYSVLTSVAVTPTAAAYRYVRYRTASGRNANISELEFYGAEPDAYLTWLTQAGLIPGAAGTGFAEDADNDGIRNGAEYMMPDGVKITASSSSSGVTAIVRNDATVTGTLWVSGNLSDWSQIGVTLAEDQTGVPAGFMKIQAQTTPETGETKKFYRLKFVK